MQDYAIGNSDAGSETESLEKKSLLSAEERVANPNEPTDSKVGSEKESES